MSSETTIFHYFYVIYSTWIIHLLEFFTFKISNSKIENILNDVEESFAKKLSINKHIGQVTLILRIREMENSFNNKSLPLGPNDDNRTNLGLNLAILLRSIAVEKPNSRLKFITVQNVTATKVSCASNKDGTSNLQNVPQNQATKTVVSDHLGDLPSTVMVNPNPNNN